MLDAEVPVLILCLLERSCVVELLSGERTVARVERLAVDDADARWRDVQPDGPPRQQPSRREDESRARGRERSAQARRERSHSPLPGIGTTEAAELAGVSTSTIHIWLTEGRLPCTVHVVGTRTVRRVRREDVLSIKKAPATMTTTGA